MKKVVRRRVWKLKDVRSNFDQKFGKLIDIEASNLQKSFQDSILKARDEVCAKS